MKPIWRFEIDATGEYVEDSRHFTWIGAKARANKLSKQRGYITIRFFRYSRPSDVYTSNFVY